MIKIKTEIGVAAILVVTLFIAILLVVGFDETFKDMDKIKKSMDENQSVLKDINKTK